MPQRPVSVVIPMFNAEQHIVSVLQAIFVQEYAGEKEVIVVNDGSTDRSLELIKPYIESQQIVLIDQFNQGAVAATNNGFERARFDFICSIDSDVVISQDWLSKIMGEFSDDGVAAVQGYYRTPKSVSLMARMMGYDVEARYDAIRTKYVSQVCTGDTVYRKSALDRVGLFDPQFVYGYDNDMSYRLIKAGYRLVFRKDAVCDHYWKAGLYSYLKQQYRSAYGRMQLIKKHPERVSGDSVSGLRMILQVPLTMLAGLLAVAGYLLIPFTDAARILLASGLVAGVVLLADRVHFSFGIVRKHRDVVVLFLPALHLARNIIWSAALFVWMVTGRWKK